MWSILFLKATPQKSGLNIHDSKNVVRSGSEVTFVEVTFSTFKSLLSFCVKLK